MIAVPVPQATIIGNAAYLAKHFERVEGGWIAFKIFGSQYAPPEDWVIAENSIITDGVDTDPDETCSFGINVAQSVDWIQDFISMQDEDEDGNTSAKVWKVFIPDSAIIVIPEGTGGKIRVSEITLFTIIGEVYYYSYDRDDEDDF